LLDVPLEAELLQALEQRGALGIKLLKPLEQPVAYVQQLLRGEQRGTGPARIVVLAERGRREPGERGLEGGYLLAKLAPRQRPARGAGAGRGARDERATPVAAAPWPVSSAAACCASSPKLFAKRAS